MKWMIIAAAIATLPATTNAQFGNLLKKAKGKVENKVSQRVDNKMDKAIDKSLDKAEDAAKPTSTAAAPAASVTGNDTESSAASTSANPINRLSKFDFIAGEQIVYYDNFETEAIAELPTGWNTSGSGEVVTINGIAGKWLSMHQPFFILPAMTKHSATTTQLNLI